MRIRLRTRITLNFVAIIALVGVLGGALSATLIARTTLAEAQRRVSLDLRAAWRVLDDRRSGIQLTLALLAPGKRVGAALADRRTAAADLEAIRRQADLDFLGLTDAHGTVLARGRSGSAIGDDLSADPFVAHALTGASRAGFALLSRDRLLKEGEGLADQAFTRFAPTPRARPRAETSQDDGMVLMAATPVPDGRGGIAGVLYGGVLLNRNDALVDGIRSAVFEDEKYHGRHLGTVTVFQWDVRVATNVPRADGGRAIGTRVSAEVYENVLERGLSWYDRAFVVNDWYISAYDPIRDVTGRTIGIIYVGVLARRYDDMRRDLLALYAGLAVLLGVVAFVLGLVFARRLTRSLGRVTAATAGTAGGDLNLTVPEPHADDEVRDLTRDFNTMAASLRERDERLRQVNSDLAHANARLAKLNANYLDMLGFVSHELKNTLGVVYTAAASLDAGLVGDLTAPQARLAASISRSIRSAVQMTRNYLDLARIERGELRLNRRPIDIVADVVRPTLDELADAAANRRVTIESDLPDRAPLSGDAELLKVVYRNLIDNALKYGREGGTIRLGFERRDDVYHLEVWNEGDGLTPEQVDRLFQKFVRVHEGDSGRPKGTGLGLFITREIVRKHGGDMRADAGEGHWVAFRFTLPADAPGDDGAPPTPDARGR